MVSVLIVEDSPLIREYLRHILNLDPAIRIVGQAANGQEAVALVKQLQPDVITMDIHMPVMNGFEATRRIMEESPTPIVIVSGSASAREVSTTFQALEAGALAIVARPRGLGHPDFEDSAAELRRTVKLMSEVRVVRRWPRKDHLFPDRTPLPAVNPGDRIRVIVIGSSTGGPVALRDILSRLPPDFAVPIVIVQHMSRGFIQGLADWLSFSTRFPVVVASQGEQMQPGKAYLAPDDCQIGVRSDKTLFLDRPSSLINPVCPSVAYLFHSAAAAFGPQAVGILLTGMGRDGAEELKLLRTRGAITIAQDKESSVVFGMPGEAVQIDAAVYVLPPDKIASTLINLVNGRQRRLGF